MRRKPPQTVQSLVKPNALTEILGTPSPRENPNRAPRGVMAFVSLTMPDTTLKQLLRQSAHTEVPLIIRGVLPQGFDATTGRIAKLVGMNTKTPINSGFAISPEWFERFNVSACPPFVSIKDGHCLPKQPCTSSDYDIVYGNISLYQALAFLEDGDAAQNVTLLNQKVTTMNRIIALLLLFVSAALANEQQRFTDNANWAKAHRSGAANHVKSALDINEYCKDAACQREVANPSQTQLNDANMDSEKTRAMANNELAQGIEDNLDKPRPDFRQNPSFVLRCSVKTTLTKSHTASQINTSTVTPTSSACLMTTSTTVLRPHARPYPAENSAVYADRHSSDLHLLSRAALWSSLSGQSNRVSV